VMLAALKKGDEVVLTSGMFGKVHAVEDKVVVVEIADKTRVRVLKVGVHGPASRVFPAQATAADDKKLEAPAAPADKTEKKPA
jgi:preprotein translocase subunit YajC